MGAYTSWGGEYASVLPLVDIVDWHCYNGAGNGAAVAAEIASMQAIAGVKPLLLTEVIARPSQPLAAALPVARAAGVGVFIWALIFTPGNWWSVPYLPGGPPFQGFLFPNGTAYDEVEEVALLQRRSGSVVYRAANFDANAPFIFGGGWTPMAAGCSAASCEYQSSKGPREGAAQSTTDSGANVTITLPANTAAFALYAPQAPTGCKYTVKSTPGDEVLASGTSAGPLVWEGRSVILLPQPPPVAVVLMLQPQASSGWQFFFAGVTFFDDAPPSLPSVL